MADINPTTQVPAATARITIPPGHRFPWYVRLILANHRRRYGQELEAGRIWGRTPKLFAVLSLLVTLINRKSSPLPPRLRFLVNVRVSQINWCVFCVDLNAALGLRQGLRLEDFDALPAFETSPLFTERERAALAYTEAMTDSTRGVDDALMARLKRFFDDDAVVELTALVAFQNMSSKFNAALAVPAQGFCRRPQSARPTDSR